MKELIRIELPVISEKNEQEIVSGEKYSLILYERCVEFISGKIVANEKNPDTSCMEEIKYDHVLTVLKRCICGVDYYFNDNTKRYRLAIIMKDADENWLITCESKIASKEARDKILNWLISD